MERALSSALAQTYPDVEIIVSDNGSTDATPQVLQRYEDPRLRKFRRDDTLPITEHGRFLVDQVQGEFAVFLSDDDYLEPEFAARAVDLLDQHPDLAFLYSRSWVHYGSVKVPSLAAPEVESGRDFLRQFYAGNREVCWCACVVRTATLQRIGPIPDGRIFGDMYYWTKLAFDGDVGCVQSLQSHYTFMGDNVSSAVPVSLWATETRLLADEVIAGFESGKSSRQDVEALRAASADFVARSTANQFFWNALRGADRELLWGELRSNWQFLKRHPRAWPRLLAGFVLKPAHLRTLILGAARRRARERLESRRG